MVRGGFGIFHDASLLNASDRSEVPDTISATSFVSAADGVTPTIYLSNPFPGGLVPITGNSQGVLAGIGTDITPSLLGDNRVAYSENWNLNVQQQLPGNILVEAAYLGRTDCTWPSTTRTSTNCAPNSYPASYSSR